ncbi:hypothetical protein V8C34DRAFT_291130, partial [Trichoderma compactum]
MVEVFSLSRLFKSFISTLFASPSFASIPLIIHGLPWPGTGNIHKSGAETSVRDSPAILHALETRLLVHDGM